MTERTLREKIAALPRYRKVSSEPGYSDMMMVRPDGGWLSREAVLALLDAHTAAQPAPDAVAEARALTDTPAQGTWAVLYPGYYGPFTACWADGAWRLCEDADLKLATHWTPLDIAALAKGSRP